ncbi:hypothetical protein HYQ46_002799 [Verticillium longisporum]|nr:hypothetical protein HYQ46_002799 [Verticillium longisporum]
MQRVEVPPSASFFFFVFPHVLPPGSSHEAAVGLRPWRGRPRQNVARLVPGEVSSVLSMQNAGDVADMKPTATNAHLPGTRPHEATPRAPISDSACSYPRESH